MGTYAPLPRAVPRAVVACVVLIGLFLMHGLTGSSCAGQPEGGASSMSPASSVSPASMVPAAISRAAMSYPLMESAPSSLAHSAEAAALVAGASAAEAGAASRSAPVAVTGLDRPSAGMAGALCVSRPPASGPAGLLALLLVAGVLAFGEVAGLAGPTGRFLRGRGLRAPPPAGALLLVRLCISRT